MATNFRDIYVKWAAEQQIVAHVMKAARCWAGYEPVPGKAPYSEDSCRPAGSKKKKKDTKKEAASAMFHHQKKELEPVVNGKKPSTENTKHVKVVPTAPGNKEDLRPEAADGKPAAG